jgi:hypothetical protein
MKLILLTLFQLISFYAMAQDQSLSAYKKQFSGELKDWALSFTNFTLSEFRLAETRPFDHNNPQDWNLLKSFYSIYKPILTFSKDSIRFIDIYSYRLNLEKKGTGYLANLDPDQAIYLFDKKAKYWDRIYFATAAKSIDEVIWISNTQFMLTGTSKNKQEQRAPMIMIGDEVNKTLKVYSNTNTGCLEKSGGYRSPKLRRLSIEGF